jgi:endonuclease/exonuclease/phosphatase family metal-dependent hydrolase
LTGVVRVVTALTLGLVAWTIVAPSRTGLPGLMAIFLPYSLVVALAAVGCALLVRRRQALVLMAMAIAITALVAPRVTGLLPGQARAIAVRPVAGVATVHLVTYNTYVFDRSPPERLIGSLVAEAPAIVALQELAPERAMALDADPDIRRLFPYRQLRITGAFGGPSLLSSYPIDVAPAIDGVSLIEATAHVDGRRLAVLAAHALPPLALAPFPFQPGPRDAMLAAFRDRMLARLAAGDRVVLMGDLNTTDREVAFHDLADGFVDVHATVGSGLGHTWGLPPWPIRLPPLLRIDHMLLSTDLVALDTGVTCGASDSDHCLLRSTVGLSE